MLATNCVFTTHFFEKPLAKHPPLPDGQEVCGLALASCGMGKVIVHG
jgi:hypothetical protein